MLTHRVGLGSLGALSPEDIYRYARDAGFPPDTAVKMVAIAMKESGGNPAAYNGRAPDDSYGLWQINMFTGWYTNPRTGTTVYRDEGGPRRAMWNLSDNSQLFDPATNARAAYSLWGGNDRNLDVAWAIQKSAVDAQRYQAYLPRAVQARANVEGGPGTVGAPLPAEEEESSTEEEELGTGYSSNGEGLDPKVVALAVGAALLLLYHS